MKTLSIPVLLLTALGVTALSGCITGGGDVEIFGDSTGGTLRPGVIKQEGSSTVLPLAERWAEEFGVARGVQITVAGGGSGKGATGICNGELDLGDMSRAMRDSEREGDCADNGITPVEWIVAFDGLSVAVSLQNDFVQDLNIEQLNHIFRSEDHATRWNQVEDSFPDQPIRLCYPDSDSGTYEYFNEEVLPDQSPRTGTGVQQSPNDNVLVQCLTSDEYAIGYFGFAYIIENQDRVRAIAVDGVEPSFETIADGSYSPLSRPLYIYTNGVPAGILNDYFSYVYHPDGGQAIIEDVGYVALDENTRLRMLNQLEG